MVEHEVEYKHDRWEVTTTIGNKQYSAYITERMLLDKKYFSYFLAKLLDKKVQEGINLNV